MKRACLEHAVRKCMVFQLFCTITSSVNIPSVASQREKNDTRNATKRAFGDRKSSFLSEKRRFCAFVRIRTSSMKPQMEREAAMHPRKRTDRHRDRHRLAQTETDTQNAQHRAQQSEWKSRNRNGVSRNRNGSHGKFSRGFTQKRATSMA